MRNTLAMTMFAAIMTMISMVTSAASMDHGRAYDKVGNWLIIAYAEDEECATVTGRSLEEGMFVIVLGHDGVSMAFIDSDWNIPKGQYPIVINVDGDVVVEEAAQADTSQIGLRIRQKADVMHEIALGHTLTLEAGELERSFSLNGAASATISLAECYETLYADTGDSNPFE